MTRPAMHSVPNDRRYPEINIKPGCDLLDGEHDLELGALVRRMLDGELPVVVVVRKVEDDE